ncbi:MAG: hypothetical protein LUG16_03830, partial [Candidatus Gastranaerophilales bacterium]|nr:hypothetical protein [Candidatus Gastranaerophilales bacterium]
NIEKSPWQSLPFLRPDIFSYKRAKFSRRIYTIDYCPYFGIIFILGLYFDYVFLTKFLLTNNQIINLLKDN